MNDAVLIVLLMVTALALLIGERRRRHCWLAYLVRRATSESELAARERVACLEAVSSLPGGLQLRAVAVLCGQLVDQGCQLARLADQQRPWSEIEPELGRSHRLLEELANAHNNLVRRIEQRYADEIEEGQP